MGVVCKRFGAIFAYTRTVHGEQSVKPGLPGQRGSLDPILYMFLESPQQNEVVGSGL